MATTPRPAGNGPERRRNRFGAAFLPALSGIVLSWGAGAGFAAAPAETPVACVANYYHVYIHNDSRVTVEAGSVVEWHVPFTRSSGRHELHAPLEPGSRILLANALGSDYILGDGDCDARLILYPADH